uniref:Putative BEL1-like homeodomain protein 1 n=1 Tax=Davidia involucrata TaxID=16924 RepID=A0A5B6ZAN8_DAVIN
MATYFHGNSEIQGDGLQTLILMNPGYVGYSDTQPPPPPPANFFFLNSPNNAGNSLNPANLPHAPPYQAHHLVGIPLQTTAATATAPASSQDPHPPSLHSQHDISALHGFFPRVQYNMYNSIEPTAARELTRAQQGLSLSLSSQQPAYGSYRDEREVPSQAAPPTISLTHGDDVRVSGGSPSSVSGISNGVNSMQNVLLSSKYLKAAQELLDEVVNVGKGVKNESAKGTNGQSKTIGESSASAAAVAGEGLNGGEKSTKPAAELTTAERQEIQMKKAKLVNMLDEVEQRYRQYHHQMQIVISWFERVSGIGSAKTYTALALQTISKQFRCLKDAITGQIRAASKSLGEEDCLGGKIEGSRLKFVDHQLRQQRALQQFGMIQHNAWRPQRGLPERSVSVLRAWLFEHFLHPYPKDSDKHMLAKQTGLTRSQVSNWFINARVRLWKPMVEEMYMEEIKEQEQNGSEDKTSKSEHNEDSVSKSIPSQEKSPATENQNRSFKSKHDNPSNQNTPPGISMSTSSMSPTGVSIHNQSGFTQVSPKKLRGIEMLQSPNSVSSMDMDVKAGNEGNNEHVFMKFGNERQRRDGFTLMGSPTNLIGGFGSYPIGEIGRFGAEQFPATYSSNAVSLTLGLPHCENLSMSGTHQTFLPNQNIQLGRRVEIGDPNEFGSINASTPSHSSTIYDSINIQNRKRFAAQLLPDFVA